MKSSETAPQSRLPEQEYWYFRFCFSPEPINNRREKGWPVKQMPSFACKDIGMACPFKAEAPTEAELMKKVAEHAKAVHKIDPVPADLAAKIKAAIKK